MLIPPLTTADTVKGTYNLLLKTLYITGGTTGFFIDFTSLEKKKVVKVLAK